MELRCRGCGGIIVDDFNQWFKENPNSRYIQCPNPHCCALIKLDE